MIGAVNLSEVVAKLQGKGVPNRVIESHLADLDLELDIAEFDQDQAILAGMLRNPTKAAGPSLGDRCCLALAQARGGTAVTSDRDWAELALPIEIEVIR